MNMERKRFLRGQSLICLGIASVLLVFVNSVGLQAQVEENAVKRQFIRFNLLGLRWTTTDQTINNQGVLTSSQGTVSTPLFIPFPISYGEWGDYYMWELRLNAFALSQKPVQSVADVWGYFKTYSRWNRSAFYIGAGLGYYRYVDKFEGTDQRADYSGIQAGWGMGGLIGTESKHSFVDISLRYYFLVGNPARVTSEDNASQSIRRGVNNAYDISFSYLYAF